MRTIPTEDDILLIGDGEVVVHLADQVRGDDAQHGRERRIEVAQSSPLTERQLVARIRAFAGHAAARRPPR